MVRVLGLVLGSGSLSTRWVVGVMVMSASFGAGTRLAVTV